MASDTPRWAWNDSYDTPRDLVGYGAHPPNPQWPNNARIAVSFVINYEEGGEYTVLNGDDHSETYLGEAVGGKPKIQQRSTNSESEYDYGARAGIWRLLRLFSKYDMKITIYAVGKALEANPEAAKAMAKEGHDVASHAYRWIDYSSMSPDEEEVEIRKCVEVHQDLAGYAPRGWYVGRLSARSHSIIRDVYNKMDLPSPWISDSYADDLPYWQDLPRGQREQNKEGTLIIPYSLDCNDFKFNMPNNWSAPSDFVEYLKNAFDVLYEEGEEGAPKMMSIGLHCRISGHPGRLAALRQFLEYIKDKDGVWVTTVSPD